MAVQAATAKFRQAQAERETLRLQQQQAAARAEQQAAEERATEQKQLQIRSKLQELISTGDDMSAAAFVPSVDSVVLGSADSHGETALHAAAAHGLVECSEAILKQADLKLDHTFAPDDLGRTPLHCAAAVDTSGKLCALLAANQACKLDALDHHGRTALQVAQTWGMAQAAKAIQQQLGKPRQCKSLLGQTRNQQNSISRVTRAEEASVAHESVEYTCTAGYELVAADRIHDAESLVKDREWRFVNETDHRGRTLLHIAAAQGLSNLCSLILEREDFTKLESLDKERATALHLAAANRQASCCRAIVESGRLGQVNAVDLNGQTALHLAALRADEESYKTISSHRACDAALPDRFGRSAAEYAVERYLDVELPEPLASQIES